MGLLSHYSFITVTDFLPMFCSSHYLKLSQIYPLFIKGNRKPQNWPIPVKFVPKNMHVVTATLSNFAVNQQLEEYQQG